MTGELKGKFRERLKHIASARRNKNNNEELISTNKEISSELKDKNNLRNNQKNYFSYIKKGIVKNKDTNKVESIDDINERIIRQIESKLNKERDELEAISGELYVIEQFTKEEFSYEESQENLKSINELSERLNKIKEEFYLFKNDKLIDHSYEISDEDLRNEIILLKELYERKMTLPNLKDQYKLIEDYLFILEKIDNLSLMNQELGITQKETTADLEKRDKEFIDFRERVINLELFNSRIEDLLIKQDAYLNELKSKIAKIDQKEVVTYEMTGLNKLLGQSLKYIGLLLVSPFTGLVPGIALSTIATKKMIDNLRKNTELTKKTKIVYSVENYTDDINLKLNDVDNVYRMLDDTINDVNGYKEEFKEKYEKYKSKIPEYEEVFNKLDKFSELLEDNKIKLEAVNKNLRASKKINEKAMARVKSL